MSGQYDIFAVTFLYDRGMDPVLDGGFHLLSLGIRGEGGGGNKERERTVPRLRLSPRGEVVDGELHINAVLEARLGLGFQEPVVPLAAGFPFRGGCSVGCILGCLWGLRFGGCRFLCGGWLLGGG